MTIQIAQSLILPVYQMAALAGKSLELEFSERD